MIVMTIHHVWSRKELIVRSNHRAMWAFYPVKIALDVAMVSALFNHASIADDGRVRIVYDLAISLHKSRHG